jgi:hypothetical protein
MQYILIFLIIIVILIVFTYGFYVGAKDAILATTDKKIYAKSNGTLDGPARKVLDNLAGKKNKTPNETGLLGRVISEVILEGETPITGRQRQFTMMAANNFNNMLGEFNPVEFDTHLLMVADTFNQRLNNALFIGGDMLFPGENDEFNFVVHNLGQNIGVARKITNESIKQQQKDITDSAAEAMIGYFDAAKIHTSDNQNSHDPGVSAGISASLNIIEIDESNLPAEENTEFSLAEIRNYINKSNYSADKKNKALYSLKLIGEKNEMVSAVNKRELDAIRDVWIRSSHPGNRDNKTNIRDALIDALVDIMEPNGWAQTNAACVSGRVGRIVGSLAAIDFDERVGNLATKEQIENQILDNAGQIVNKYFEENKTGKFADIVNMYNTKDGPDELNESNKGSLLAEFMTGLKKKIDEMLIENNASVATREKVYAGL